MQDAIEEFQLNIPTNLPNQPMLSWIHNHEELPQAAAAEEHHEQVQENGNTAPNGHHANGHANGHFMLHRLPAQQHQYHPIHYHTHTHLTQDINTQNFNNVPSEETLRQLEVENEIPEDDHHKHVHQHIHHHVLRFDENDGQHHPGDDEDDLNNLNFALFPPIFQ